MFPLQAIFDQLLNDDFCSFKIEAEANFLESRLSHCAAQQSGAGKFTLFRASGVTGEDLAIGPHQGGNTGIGRTGFGKEVLAGFDGIHIVAALIILTREIAVSGLREFLAGLQVSVPVSRLAKWKTALQLVALGALILGGATPGWPWVHGTGLVGLWTAAILTVVTGWDYLRTGLKHMD